MYLPVPLFGYLCDRYSPGLISLFSSFLFGAGYLLAALTYRNGPPVAVGGHGWPTAVMVLAFVGVGAGTCSMYLAAVTTCAKNFGRGKHKGLALGLPIAAFGLGGMWQSQFGSRFLFEEDPQGGRGDVDVFKFFIFLSGLLFAVGLVGALGLQIVDEEELIDEAVEELERSGLLDNSDLFRSSPTAAGPNYGTLRDSNISSGDLEARREEAPGHPKATTRTGQVEKSKKTWLLNTETRRFLSDHTMWWLAAGFFLVTGPGEAFINNVRIFLMAFFFLAFHGDGDIFWGADFRVIIAWHYHRLVELFSSSSSRRCIPHRHYACNSHLHCGRHFHPRSHRNRPAL